MCVRLVASRVLLGQSLPVAYSYRDPTHPHAVISWPHLCQHQRGAAADLRQHRRHGPRGRLRRQVSGGHEPRLPRDQGVATGGRGPSP